MKFLLNQLTSAGTISIATAEGAYHVVWKDRSVAVAETLVEALTLACEGRWANDFADTQPAAFLISTRPDDWFVAA